jgi:CheY-like chemotaxis protein
MVDDEAELVHATVGMLGREVGPAEVQGTTDPRELVTWIATTKPTALITDVRMPFVNGLELVTQLHERWGPVPVVVMTAYPTAQVAEDARAGRFAYLPKPFSFQTLKETLHRVCSRPAPSAFSGAIAVTMLGEVVQLYGLANRTGRLIVQGPDGQGEIAFENGRVVDAVTHRHRGVAAFNAILAWTSGSFSWDPRPPVGHTIQTSLSELLIDAYRLQDERDAGIVMIEDEVDLDLEFAILDGTVDDAEADDVAEAIDKTTAPIVEVGNIIENLARLQEVEGFTAAAVYDMRAGACAAILDPDDEANVAMQAAGHVDVVRAKRDTISALQLDDQLEDIIITMKREYHLLRVCRRHPHLFFFLVLDRQHANLAMARYLLANAESNVVL